MNWFGRMELVLLGRMKKVYFGRMEMVWFGRMEMVWFELKTYFRIGSITKYLDNKHFMIKIFFFLDKTLNSYRFISKIVGLYDLKKKKKKISRNLENSTVCNSRIFN